MEFPVRNHPPYFEKQKINILLGISLEWKLTKEHCGKRYNFYKQRKRNRGKKKYVC